MLFCTTLRLLVEDTKAFVVTVDTFVLSVISTIWRRGCGVKVSLVAFQLKLRLRVNGAYGISLGNARIYAIVGV